MKFVVAYDVEDIKRRNKIQKFISAYSDDFQKSVYEIEVTKSQIKEIYAFLDEICEEGDRFLIFPIIEGFSFGKNNKVEFII